jgi:hypothetical protein
MATQSNIPHSWQKRGVLPLVPSDNRRPSLFIQNQIKDGQKRWWWLSRRHLILFIDKSDATRMWGQIPQSFKITTVAFLS